MAQQVFRSDAIMRVMAPYAPQDIMGVNHSAHRGARKVPQPLVDLRLEDEDVDAIMERVVMRLEPSEVRIPVWERDAQGQPLRRAGGRGRLLPPAPGPRLPPPPISQIVLRRAEVTGRYVSEAAVAHPELFDTVTSVELRYPNYYAPVTEAPEEIRRILHAAPHAQRVLIEHMYPGLLQIPWAHPELRELTMEYVSLDAAWTWPATLTRLNLTSVNNMEHHLVLPPTLTDLRLNFRHTVQIPIECTSLTRLSLQGFPNIDAEFRLWAPRLVHLESLCVRVIPGSVILPELLPLLPHLRSLQVKMESPEETDLTHLVIPAHVTQVWIERTYAVIRLSLSVFLRRNPHLRGIVLELIHVDSLDLRGLPIQTVIAIHCGSLQRQLMGTRGNQGHQSWTNLTLRNFRVSPDTHLVVAARGQPVDPVGPGILYRW